MDERRRGGPASGRPSGIRGAIPLLKRFYPWMRPHMRYVWAVVANQVITTPLAIVVPLVVRSAVDRLMDSGGAISDLLPWGGLLILLALISTAAGIYAGTLLVTFRVKVLHDLRMSLFRHVMGLSSAYHAAHETGRLMSRQIDDVRNLNAVMADAAARIFVMALRAIAFLGMLFYIEWRLASGAVLLIGSVYGIAYLTSPHLRRLATDALAKATDLSSAIHQALSGHPLIQSTAGETREALRFAKVLHSSIRADVKRDLFALYYQNVYLAATTAGPALVVLAGIWLVATTGFTIGGLVAFFLYLGRLLVLVANLAGFNTQLQGSLASLARIFEVLDAQPEVKPPSGTIRKLEVIGELRFEGVSFAYEPGRLVLRDIDLDVAPCSRIALVGHSGAGKSTLASLVPRFFDPVSGRVLVDGVDLRQLDLRRYRQQVGFVPQDVFLFDRTIGENIAIGRERATHEEVRRAAAAAHALEFIEELPEGFDTPIGERGVKLSGGQRQRLAIARELLRDPRILILDEATSAVDSHSEALIQSALEHLLRGRTSIVIAHRLSTVIGSDLILVMEQGCIVERGCHDELLALDDIYAGLYNRQFEGPAWL